MSKALITMEKLLVLTLIIYSLQATAAEEGDKCSESTKLPSYQTCFNREVYDCLHPQGRMGYVACESSKTEKLEKELEHHYKSLLSAFNKQSKYGQDFDGARTSLLKAKSAWESLTIAECSLENSLIGTLAIDCRNSRITEQIEYLKSLEKDLE